MVVVSTPERTSSSRRQVVFSFDEFTASSFSAAVRGGKGFHLMGMTALGLPVPPGFTVTTTVARAYQETGSLPKRFWSQFDRALSRLERQTGKRFGDPTNPLLLSVRSGAEASMPGMLDTVLNIGMNESVAEFFARTAGEEFAHDTFARFQAQFQQLVQDDVLVGSVPNEPRAQLLLALDAVMRSWTSERAQAYRAANNLPEWWGTAVNIQAMVFGNLDDQSGTGVVFSHDVVTGQPGLYGEFLPRAQGEDVVAGVRTPQPIAEMAEWAPSAYESLTGYVGMLSKHFGDIVDVEFTVEGGELYLLQVRRAKATPRAAVTYAVHETWAKRLSREEALERVPREIVDHVVRSELDVASDQYELRKVLATGLAASPGAVVGEVVFSSARARELAALGRHVILVTRDTSPEDLPGMLASVGLVTQTGGATCHAAIVTRELGLPSVVGASDLDIDALVEGQVISVDGTRGMVMASELPLITPELTKEENIFLRWRKRLTDPIVDFESLGGLWSANTLLREFYVSDALARSVEGTTHYAAASRLRDQLHRSAASKFVMYLLVAVAGEVRHALENNICTGQSLDSTDSLMQEWSLAPYMDRSRAQESVINSLEQADSKRVGEFFALAERVFTEGVWSSKYGGAKWADIARTAKLYLAGSLPHAVFVDHVFDLRHNGGVLFNKHRMFNECTRELDLQYELNIKKEARGLEQLCADLSVSRSRLDPDLLTMLETVRPGVTTSQRGWY